MGVFSTDSLAGPLTRPFCPPSAGQHQRVAGFPVSPTRGVAAQGPLFICSARTELTGQCSFQGCNRLNADTCAWTVKLSQEKSIKSKCICTSNSIQRALTRLHLTLGWQRFLWRKRLLIMQVLYELLHSLRLVPTLGTNVSDYLNRKSGFSEKLQPRLVSFRLLRPPWTNCSFIITPMTTASCKDEGHRRRSRSAWIWTLPLISYVSLGSTWTSWCLSFLIC